jgi:hypothetical protein
MTKFEAYNNTGGTKFSPGIPPVYVFCGFAVVMCILAISIWLVTPLLDNAVSTVVSNTPISKNEVTQALTSLGEKASLNLERDSNKSQFSGVDYGSITLESIPNGLVVHRKYQDDIEILNRSNKGQKHWLAILKDPYSTLSTVGGDPFFDSKKYNIPSTGSVLPFKTNSDKTYQINSSTFPIFKFFSDSPSTIGIVKGEYSVDLKFQSITLYLFDTESPKSAVINNPSISFPGWIKQQDNAPSYYTVRYVTLTPAFNALGDGVFDNVLSYLDAEYQHDAELQSKMFVEQFNNAMLTRAELKTLETSNIDKLESFKQENLDAVRKLVRLIYYSRSANKTGAVKALLEKVHPSIKKAALSRFSKELA